MRFNFSLLEAGRDSYIAMLKPLEEYIQSLNKEYDTKTMARNMRQCYRTSDRIVWALRWRRMWDLAYHVDSFNHPLMQRFMRDAGVSHKNRQQMKDEFKIFIDKFENRFMDQHTPPVENPEELKVLWGRSSPSELDKTLESLRKKGDELKARQAPHAKSSVYPNSKKIMDVGDLTWWNLGKDFCQYEGDAMGHCGNDFETTYRGNLLSLRKDINDRKQMPFVTIVLDTDGLMREIKGRNDKSPIKKYNPYILELLKKPFIKGFLLTSNYSKTDFHIVDLSTEEILELANARPDLFSHPSGLANNTGGMRKLFNTMAKARGYPKIVEFDDYEGRVHMISDNEVDNLAVMTEWGRLEDAVKVMKSWVKDTKRSAEKLGLDIKTIQQYWNCLIQTLNHDMPEEYPRFKSVEGDYGLMFGMEVVDFVKMVASDEYPGGRDWHPHKKDADVEQLEAIFSTLLNDAGEGLSPTDAAEVEYFMRAVAKPYDEYDDDDDDLDEMRMLAGVK